MTRGRPFAPGTANGPRDVVRLSADEPATVENYEAACEARRLFDNFLAYVREVQAERRAAD